MLTSTTAQKMKFLIKDFSSKNVQIFNGKLHFLCSVYIIFNIIIFNIAKYYILLIFTYSKFNYFQIDVNHFYA